MYKNYKKLLEKYRLNKFLEDLSTNKLVIGILMLFMNIGSRYIELRLTSGQEMIL